MTELAHHPEDLDGHSHNAADQYQNLGPRPGDSFQNYGTGDLDKAPTAPLDVFYGRLADQVNFELEEARRISGDPELAREVKVLREHILAWGNQDPVVIPGEHGQPITHKDDYVRNEVGNAIRRVATAYLKPELDGEPTILRGSSGTRTQELAINAELEGILGVQATGETDIPGLHMEWGPPYDSDRSRRNLLMVIGEPQPRGRHSRSEAPGPAHVLPEAVVPTRPEPVSHQPAEPVEAVRSRGRHEFNPANRGAQIYSELLALAPTGPDAYPGDGIFYSRKIRERLRDRIDAVSRQPLPQLEHDRTGEAAARFADAMRRTVDFVDPHYDKDILQNTVDLHDPRAGMPEYTVVYQGADPREDPDSDLVRLEMIQLLGNARHETDVRNLDVELEERTHARPEDRTITTVTIESELDGIYMQIQILNNIGFDGHRRPGSRMRISLNRPK